MKHVHNLFLLIILFSCHQSTTTGQVLRGRITPGAEQTELYWKHIEGKKIGLVVNQTSTIAATHLADYLLERDISVVRLFTPEHGFRGKEDAGAKVSDGRDPKTGLSIVSLYGKNKKPSAESLEGLDVLIFDIQDVGVRFYTYISTLHYVMEAAAEQGVKVIVMDRPNPHAHYVDGPVLKEAFSSFVGMHPVPVIYGLTIGEYAQMINGEAWLSEGIKCDLTIIPVSNYLRSDQYILPIKPSPNLPNNLSIGHYPSLCFFEGTTLSVGRGTTMPFQIIGHPGLEMDFTFTPQSTEGARYPKHENELCTGLDLRNIKPASALDLSYLITMHDEMKSRKLPFFNDDNFFNLLAGTDELKKDIISQKPLEEIKASWEKGLIDYKIKRRQYLIYD